MDFIGSFKNKISCAERVTTAIQQTFDEVIRIEPVGEGKFKIFSAETGNLLATVKIEQQ